MSIKAQTITVTLTREQLSTILGGLNTGAIARRKEGRRYRKNPIAARACGALSESISNAFCLLVQARQDADFDAAWAEAHEENADREADFYDEADFYQGCDDGQGPRYGYDTTGGECEWGID